MKKLSIIISAYNEEKVIREVLDKVSAVRLINGVEKEVILVDDCSKDNTPRLAQSYISTHPGIGIKFLQHRENKGKGASVRTGIAAASGDYIAIQDADLEYDPEELNSLLRPIHEDRADVVYGSRFIGSNPHRMLFFWHYMGNKFLTLFSNLCCNLNLTDMETGCKMFRAEIIKRIELKEDRFGFEPEVVAKVASIPDIRIYEVGVSYYGRTYKEGKKIGWRDGVRAVFCILRYNFFK